MWPNAQVIRLPHLPRGIKGLIGPEARLLNTRGESKSQLKLMATVLGESFIPPVLENGQDRGKQWIVPGSC